MKKIRKIGLISLIGLIQFVHAQEEVFQALGEGTTGDILYYGTQKPYWGPLLIDATTQLSGIVSTNNLPPEALQEGGMSFSVTSENAHELSVITNSAVFELFLPWVDVGPGLIGGNQPVANQLEQGAIAMGFQALASGAYSLAVGGAGSSATEDKSTTLGGELNVSSGYLSTTIGGASLLASGDGATAAGGRLNKATGFNSFVGGGYNNEASGPASIASGNGNTASGNDSGVFAGSSSMATQNKATVIGGQQCVAGGWFTSVQNSLQTSLSGFNSMAVNFRTAFSSALSYAFFAQADNGYYFYTDAANSQLVKIDGNANLSVDGTVTAAGYITSSSETLKKNIQDMDLEKRKRVLKNIRPKIFEKRFYKQISITNAWGEVTASNAPVYKKALGMIAENVNDQLEAEFGIERTYYDETNRVEGVNIEQVLALLLARVQDLEATIEKLSGEEGTELEVGRAVVLEIAATYDNAYTLPATKRKVKQAIDEGLIDKESIRDRAYQLLEER